MDTLLLLGMMGSGKSTLGVRLAQNLHYSFRELDQKVLEATGYPSIEEVYRDRKSLWHEKELVVMQDLSSQRRQIIACGGGIVENMLNFEYFQECPFSFLAIYLRVSPKVLFERFQKNHPEISEETKLLVRENFERLFLERDPIYRRIANIVIENDEENIGKSVSDILQVVSEFDA